MRVQIPSGALETTCYSFVRPSVGFTRLGRFQYGDLHFGQTRGSWSLRGSHSCSHRSQRKPQTTICTFAIVPIMYLLVSFVKDLSSRCRQTAYPLVYYL